LGVNKEKNLKPDFQKSLKYFWVFVWMFDLGLNIRMQNASDGSRS
jgi:hypothetical protein